MKKRRTEKTVRRNFIYMGKASEIAVKQKQWLSPQDCLLYTNGLEVASQPLLRCSKYGGVTPYFDRCAILASLHLPPAALGDEARHARASESKSFYSMPKQKRSPFGNRFCLAGAEGLEPSARGFGDRCSTNWAIPLYLFNFQDKMYYIKLCVICQGIFEK